MGSREWKRYIITPYDFKIHTLGKKLEGVWVYEVCLKLLKWRSALESTLLLCHSNQPCTERETYSTQRRPLVKLIPWQRSKDFNSTHEKCGNRHFTFHQWNWKKSPLTETHQACRKRHRSCEAPWPHSAYGAVCACFTSDHRSLVNTIVLAMSKNTWTADVDMLSQKQSRQSHQKRALGKL